MPLLKFTPSAGLLYLLMRVPVLTSSWSKQLRTGEYKHFFQDSINVYRPTASIIVKIEKDVNSSPNLIDNSILLCSDSRNGNESLLLRSFPLIMKCEQNLWCYKLQITGRHKTGTHQCLPRHLSFQHSIKLAVPRVQL